LIDILPLLVTADGTERAVSGEQGELSLSLSADIDDLCRTSWAHKKSSHRFERTLRGGKTDAEGIYRADVTQVLETETEVGTTLVSGKSMDFVDDHRVNRS
jgi:hypothetical protein